MSGSIDVAVRAQALLWLLPRCDGGIPARRHLTPPPSVEQACAAVGHEGPALVKAAAWLWCLLCSSR
jgi:hypothetical protein